MVSLVFFLVSAVLSLPWDLYANYFREKAYGRTSQPLGDFLMQGGIALLITALVGGLFMTGVYWLIRRTGKRWWMWSGGLTALVLAIFLLLSPILIEPLFNKYEPVPPGQVRDAVVEMAGRAGVPPERVFMFNGSRQSNNFTANAGGVGSTARVAISDVALKNASLDEVRAVTGHEIGHYVLKHTWYGILFLFDRRDPLLLARRPDLSVLRAAVRKHCEDRRPARNSGAAVHRRPAAIPGHALPQQLRPDDRDPGRPLFAENRKPPGRAVDRAREDRRIPLSAAGRASRRSCSTITRRSSGASAWRWSGRPRTRSRRRPM